MEASAEKEIPLPATGKSEDAVTSIMASKASLLALPPELLSNITEYIDSSDTLALRLMCRKLSAAADDAFLDAYFTERTHLYSYEALQALIDITSSAHLVRKLEKVRLMMLAPSECCYKHTDEAVAAESEIGKKQGDANIDNIWQEEMRGLARDNTAA
ncbi:hypothetical protein LTR85_005918 [Meristemomyces frigidus]|nr:hypothetical protein LTR85_005918 [Meristemomyces frigidus]